MQISMRAILLGVSLLIVSASVNASPSLQNLQSGASETLEVHLGNGKWLVVMIWASDCEICEHEVDAYQDFHLRHSLIDAKVLGITLDGARHKDDAVRFVDRHKLRFTNLIAEPEVVTAYYQVLTGSPWIGTPSFLLFAPDGRLMAKQVGAVETEIVESFIAANSVAPD